MNYKYLLVTIISLFLVVGVLNTCSGGQWDDFLTINFNSQNSCHQSSVDFTPFKAVKLSLVAIIKQHKQDDFLKTVGSFSNIILISLLSSILFLILRSRRRLIRFKYGVARLFDKWPQLFKQGLIHPQIF